MKQKLLLFMMAAATFCILIVAAPAIACSGIVMENSALAETAEIGAEQVVSVSFRGIDAVPIWTGTELANALRKQMALNVAADLAKNGILAIAMATNGRVQEVMVEKIQVVNTMDRASPITTTAGSAYVTRYC